MTTPTLSDLRQATDPKIIRDMVADFLEHLAILDLRTSVAFNRNDIARYRDEAALVRKQLADLQSANESLRNRIDRYDALVPTSIPLPDRVVGDDGRVSIGRRYKSRKVRCYLLPPKGPGSSIGSVEGTQEVEG